MAKPKKQPTKSKRPPSKRKLIMALIEGLRDHGVYLRDVLVLEKGQEKTPRCYLRLTNTGWTCVSENDGACADGTCSYRCYVDSEGTKHHQCCKPPAGSKPCE